MAGRMEAIEEYLRSCCGFVKASLAYFIRKTIIVLTYGDDQKYATPDDTMIARMFYLSLNKNKLHNEKCAKSVKDHMAEYEIENRNVYDLLVQICKDRKNMSSNISSKGMKEGHFMPATLSG